MTGRRHDRAHLTLIQSHVTSHDAALVCRPVRSHEHCEAFDPTSVDMCISSLAARAAARSFAQEIPKLEGFLPLPPYTHLSRLLTCSAL